MYLGQLIYGTCSAAFAALIALMLTNSLLLALLVGVVVAVAIGLWLRHRRLRQEQK